MKHRRGLLALIFLAVPVLLACTGTTGSTGWAPPLELPDREGVVIARNDDKQISAIDIESARELWRFPADEDRFPGLIDDVDADAFYGRPVFLPGGEEFVVGSEEDGIIYAIRSDGSSARVLFDSDDRLIAGLVNDGAVVFLATTEEGVFAVDASAPEKSVWEYNDFGGDLWGTPALASTSAHGTLLIVPAMNGDVSALRTDAGLNRSERLAWQVDVGASVASDVLVDRGIAYFGSFDSRLYAVDVETGDVIWTAKGSGWVWGSPLIVGDVVYMSDLEGEIRAIDRTDGSAIWSEPYRAEDEVRSRPLLLEDDGLLIVDRGGHVHVLDATTGALRWTTTTPIDDDVLADPVVVVGRVIVSNDDGDIFEVLLDEETVQPLFPPPAVPGVAASLRTSGS